jgi:hypothetical protein
MCKKHHFADSFSHYPVLQIKDSTYPQNGILVFVRMKTKWIRINGFVATYMEKCNRSHRLLKYRDCLWKTLKPAVGLVCLDIFIHDHNAGSINPVDTPFNWKRWTFCSYSVHLDCAVSGFPAASGHQEGAAARYLLQALEVSLFAIFCAISMVKGTGSRDRIQIFWQKWILLLSRSK